VTTEPLGRGKEERRSKTDVRSIGTCTPSSHTWGKSGGRRKEGKRGGGKGLNAAEAAPCPAPSTIVDPKEEGKEKGGKKKKNGSRVFNP